MNPEDIESLNKFHKGLAIPLDHVPDPKDKSVLFYYTDDQKLLLVGMVESNFVFWFSETDLEDVERNRAIFAHIVRAKPTAFTDWFRMIPQTGYSFGRLASFYHERVRSGEQERKALKDTQWVTPFGHRCHVRSGPEEVGRFFADNIREHYRNLKLRCKSREAGGAYLGILQSYLEELSRSSGNPVTDYEEKKPLIDLIDSEQYLLCSDDPALRSLYLKLVYRGIELYNAYMYIVR